MPVITGDFCHVMILVAVVLRHSSDLPFVDSML